MICVQGELLCYQKICEGYESRRECVQEVMELDDKKKNDGVPPCWEKEIQGKSYGWGPLYRGCYIGLEGCYVLLPSQASTMHRHTEETKEEMKTMVHGGRV